MLLLIFWSTILIIPQTEFIRIENVSYKLCLFTFYYNILSKIFTFNNLFYPKSKVLSSFVAHARIRALIVPNLG